MSPGSHCMGYIYGTYLVKSRQPISISGNSLYNLKILDLHIGAANWLNYGHQDSSPSNGS